RGDDREHDGARCRGRHLRLHRKARPDMAGPMMSTVFNHLAWPKLCLTRRDLKRALLTGSIWGATLTVGLTAMSAWQCGGGSLLQVAVPAGLSLCCGIVGLGPLAACGRR